MHLLGQDVLKELDMDELELEADDEQETTEAPQAVEAETKKKAKKSKTKSKPMPTLGPAEIKHVLARISEGNITIGQIIGKAAKTVVKILV